MNAFIIKYTDSNHAFKNMLKMCGPVLQTSANIGLAECNRWSDE